jgi:hypothetical protein
MPDRRMRLAHAPLRSDAGRTKQGAYEYTRLCQEEDAAILIAFRRTLLSTKGWLLQEAPIGFEAGDGDLFRYVGNDPSSLTDPTGMAPNVEPTQVYPPKAGDYGAFIWPIVWDLKGAKGDGVILQKIDVDFEIRKEAKGNVGPAPWGSFLIGKVGSDKWHHWYEAWPVKNGEVEKEYRDPAMSKEQYKLFMEDFGGPQAFGPDVEAKAHDWFTGANAGRLRPDFTKRNPITWGWIYVTAKARFYPGMGLGELERSGFRRGSAGYTGAGGLYSYGWGRSGRLSPEVEKDELSPLREKGKIFEDPSKYPGNYKNFEDFSETDLAVRAFFVYWSSDGNTTILQGSCAVEAYNQAVGDKDFLHKLGPK